MYILAHSLKEAELHHADAIESLDEAIAVRDTLVSSLVDTEINVYEMNDFGDISLRE